MKYRCGRTASCAALLALALALALALTLTLAGCRAPAPRAVAPDRAASPAGSYEPLDASYDWHVLLAAPFGSVLKDVPLPLHEVLLFHDEAHAAAAPEGECYATDTPAPRFFARAPNEYLLCFTHDRLSRIQVTVRVEAADATVLFSRACAGWSKNAAAAGAGQTADSCEGRDDAVHFKARLEGGAEATVSVTLDSASDPLER